MPFTGRDKTLFRLFGLPIKADVSWLFLVALVVWTLARGFFPEEFEKVGIVVTWQTAWGLALLGAVGLFASLIAHELCHSIVARHTGMPVAGITLFIFGGVSQLQDEPPTAASEFFMAVVGPLSSVAIGLAVLAVWAVGQALDWAVGLLILLKYLWYVNFMLAAFNSLPAFPLDGGRVVRSILWAVTEDLRLATRVAVNIGSFFGFGMIFIGVFLLFQGAALVGLWLMVIGFFLRQAAMGSLQMVVIRQNLEGDKVSRFMTPNPVVVPQDLDLQRFVEEYVFRHRFAYYPVVDAEGRFVGLLSARAPRQVDAELWSQTPVSAVMVPADPSMMLDPDTDAVDALAVLRLRDEHRAVVVRDGKPIGIVSLRDLLNFLAIKIDLEPRWRRVR